MHTRESKRSTHKKARHTRKRRKHKAKAGKEEGRNWTRERGKKQELERLRRERVKRGLGRGRGALGANDREGPIAVHQSALMTAF